MITDLGTFDGQSAAVGISDGGHIVGVLTDSGGTQRAFLVTPLDTDADGVPDLWFQDVNPSDGANDLMVDLGTLGGDFSRVGLLSGVCFETCPPRTRPVTHHAVNAHGQVVGTSNTVPNGPPHAFFVDADPSSPFAMVDITPTIFGATKATAVGINSLGWVIGASDIGGFLWHNNQWTLLGDPISGTSVQANFIPTALNDLDPPAIAGVLLPTGAPARWANGIVTPLPLDGFLPPFAVLPVPLASALEEVMLAGAPWVSDINNLGWIVGHLEGHPILWTPCLVCFPEPYEAIDLDFPIPEFGGVAAVDVNDAGQVVGNQDSGNFVFRWENGVKEFGPPGRAVGMNDLGQVVIQFFSQNIPLIEPLLWEKSGELIQLGSLDPLDADIVGVPCCMSAAGVSGAGAINNKGQVVGFSSFASGSSEAHAVLWTILSPSAAASALAGKVDSLRAAGFVSPGQAIALMAKANAAGAILGDANPADDIAACRLLKAFINQVGALQNAGILTTAQVDSLVVDAMNIMNAVPCPP